MGNTKTVDGIKARQQIQAGIDYAADIVKVTIGPRGRNVVLDTNPYLNYPLNTNDGVRILRELDSDDPWKKIGIKTAKEVAEKTNDVAGDGTTTVTVLLQAIVKAGMVQLGNGVDAVQLRNDIEAAAKAVIEQVDKQVVETSDLESLINVAAISCGNRELGKIVAEVVHKVGADGVVTLEDGEDETTGRVSEGIELRGGFTANIFINRPARQESVLEDTPVFVTDQDVTTAYEIARMAETCAQAGFKRCVLVANNVTGEALVNAAALWHQNKFHILPIRVQAYGDHGKGLLRDVAIATDATFFTSDEGHRLPQSPGDPFSMDLFGHASKIIATKDRTTVIGGSGEDQIDERIKELEAQAKNAIRAFEKDQIKERIAKLRAGVGIITVGGVLGSDLEERKLRIEDAINASKAALEAGIVPGGGAALYRAAHKAFEGANKSSGIMAVFNACLEPLKQIAANGSVELDKSDLKELLEKDGQTIDFRTGELVDALKAGITDPVKVVRSALLNASSAAALFLVTEAAVSNQEDESEKV